MSKFPDTPLFSRLVDTLHNLHLNGITQGKTAQSSTKHIAERRKGRRGMSIHAACEAHVIRGRSADWPTDLNYKRLDCVRFIGLLAEAWPSAAIVQCCNASFFTGHLWRWRSILHFHVVQLFNAISVPEFPFWMCFASLGKRYHVVFTYILVWRADLRHLCHSHTMHYACLR